MLYKDQLVFFSLYVFFLHFISSFQLKEIKFEQDFIISFGFKCFQMLSKVVLLKSFADDYHFLY